MAGDYGISRPLFGGALSSSFPLRFQDFTYINIREAEAQGRFVDPGRDESLVFGLWHFSHEVEDSGSALWFLRQLLSRQGADGNMVLEHSGNVQTITLSYRDVPVIRTTAVAQVAISRGGQGREAQNVVRVYLTNLRLREVGIDLIIIAYEPLFINPFSLTARTVPAGHAIPAVQSGCRRMADVFCHAVTSFRVHNWGLFPTGG